MDTKELIYIIIAIIFLCTLCYCFWVIKYKYDKLIPDSAFTYQLPFIKQMQTESFKDHILNFIYGCTNKLNKQNTTDLNVQLSITEYRTHILDAILSDIHNFESLQEPALYALTDGKRWRSILCLQLGQQLDPRINLMPLALAVEYLHCASLILDDMPTFDNDDIRRGKESVHKKYGEGTAQLLILALIAQSYKNIYKQLGELKSKRNDVEIGLTANIIYNKIAGMMMNAISGQHIDLQALKLPKSLTNEQLIEICRKKTASFFEMTTFCTGAICGRYGNELELIGLLGQKIGIAYQIADDISDFESDHEKGKDKINIAHLDFQNAQQELNQYKNDILLLLQRLNLECPFWNEYLDLWIKPALIKIKN